MATKGKKKDYESKSAFATMNTTAVAADVIQRIKKKTGRKVFVLTHEAVEQYVDANYPEFKKFLKES